MTSPITRSFPPQFGPTLRLIPHTLLSQAIQLTSGGFGYAVDRSTGYGYVRCQAGVHRKHLRSGTHESEVASRRVPASIHFAPLYDRDNERIRS